MVCEDLLDGCALAAFLVKRATFNPVRRPRCDETWYCTYSTPQEAQLLDCLCFMAFVAQPFRPPPPPRWPLCLTIAFSRPYPSQQTINQSDKRVSNNNVASFQVLQNSRVLVCFDSRAARYPPRWLSKRGFRLLDDAFLPAAPAGSGYGYTVFAKFVHEGTEVRRECALSRRFEGCKRALPRPSCLFVVASPSRRKGLYGMLACVLSSIFHGDQRVFAEARFIFCSFFP